MKRIVYDTFLTITTQMLNQCVRWHWWSIAKTLIEFRKANIAKTLRREMASL